MKKIYIVVVLATLGLMQKTNAQDVQFGAKAGLNISNFSGGDADRNSLIGFHVGFISEIPLSEKFSLQPELLYSRQGSEAQDVVKVKVDYLAIPIMAKYYLAKDFSLEVGPQFSFLVNDKGEYIDSDLPDEDTDASSIDIGANVGLGYNLNSNMFVQARYNFGISTVAENPDIKNSVVQVSLGYKF
ncbi:porin family protein [Winogradskyella thalassocola]|uniref:Outer membrane protein beta-barrel domain-containing protein n=1 Tax=Winogradskyella thalassocola TaxID=262004 RepID=A0A1G7XS19_9FLAO|nr:porin family protein [Winogradskyella thalassocola]SDG86813.1 Outer membrane protein beta-barrel domain-containing protein [Winogradskyella thalassocola]